jgi:tetratricopeptide (TPR) repeat protein
MMLRPRAVVVMLVLLLGMVGAAFVYGCTRSSGGVTDDGAVVDTELMAYLSMARALHHEATLKEDSGDLAGAVQAMERLVAAKRPHPEIHSPEVEEVLADAYARLAELEMKRTELRRADDAIKNGLTHAPDTTYFRGHLIEIQGLIEKERATQLAAEGKTEEAAKSREKAIQLLEEVVRIQEQVIQRSLSAREAGK